MRYCDEAEGDRPIPAELFDETGELDLDHIFCSKCKLNHASDVSAGAGGLGRLGSAGWAGGGPGCWRAAGALAGGPRARAWAA